MMRMVLVVLLALLGGCAGVYRYDAEGVTAYGGRQGENNQPLYYSLAIDLEQTNTQLAALVAIRFLTGHAPIRLSELTPEETARHLPPWQPPPQWPEIAKQRKTERWKAYQVYSGEGAYLRFKDGRLTFLGLCSHCEGKRFEPPQIGPADGGTTYSLPLSEDRLREIFGEPKRMIRQREIYY